MDLIKASLLLRQLITRLARESGSESILSRYLILCAIDAMAQKGEPVNQADLSKLTGVDRSTTSGIVDTLKAKRFVILKKSKGDHRSCYIYFTESGKSLLDREQAIYTSAEKQLLAKLSPADRERFLIMLNTILASEEPVQAGLRVVK